MTLAPAAPRPRGALPLPTPAEVLDLQAEHAYPAVSVLVSTEPGPRMSRENAARLHAMVDLAVARVADECPREVTAAVADQLASLAVLARERPTRSAVALYAAPGSTAASAWSLPVHVVDRAVVDPTFATRDLVRSLHRTPRHVVLVLADDQARLFDAAGDLLIPALGGAFPLLAHRDGARRGDGRRHGGPRGGSVRGGRGEAGTDEAFLRSVDAALGAYLRLHPAPLVLAGATRTVAAFTRLSRNSARLAGVLHGSHARTPLNTLGDLVRPLLDAYLLSRQDEALGLLDERTGEGRAVTGMQAVWLAARRERPEMLVVDESFFYPARLSDDGDLVLPAPDVDHPDVVDDVVDEAIELVLSRGGWVALVEPGRLDHAERIALTLRVS